MVGTGRRKSSLFRPFSVHEEIDNKMKWGIANRSTPFPSTLILTIILPPLPGKTCCDTHVHVDD